MPAVTIAPVSGRELAVTVSAPVDRYAFFVNLRVPHAGTRFGDNYVDLEPGEQRTIAVTNATTDLAAGDVSVAAR